MTTAPTAARSPSLELSTRSASTGAAHRDGGEFGFRRDERFLKHRQVGRAAVPRTSRDLNSRSPMVSLESATLHRRDHFHPRSVFDGGVQSERGITTQLTATAALVRKAEAFEQRGDRRLISDLHSFVVHSYEPRPAAARSRSGCGVGISRWRYAR